MITWLPASSWNVPPPDPTKKTIIKKKTLWRREAKKKRTQKTSNMNFSNFQTRI
jgi:hypothetical protein